MDQNNSYVSCIKIQGVPILPPLITWDKRQELLEYKKKALLLEKLYSTRSLNNKKCDNQRKRENDKKLKIEPIILSDDQSYNLKKIQKKIENPLKYVPFMNENAKALNLSSSLLEVSEYSLSTEKSNDNQSIIEPKLTARGIITDSNLPLYSEDKDKTNTLNVFSGTTEIVLHGNSTNISLEKEPLEKPKLIRSNSYTLDNPSPLLLAHLQRQSSVSLSSDQPLTDSSKEEIENDRTKFDEDINNEKYNTIIFNNTSKENVLEKLFDTKYSHASETKKSNAVIKENQYIQGDALSQPTVEVITTDITVQQINITTPISDDIKEKDLIAFLNQSAKVNVDDEAKIETVEHYDCKPDSETELKLILKQIPAIYSSKILDLIEKQKIEQQKGLSNYEISSQEFFDRGDFQNNNNMNVMVDQENKKWEESSFNSALHVCPKNISENIEIIRKARSISESATLNYCDTLKQRSSSVADSQSLYFDMSTSCSESLEDCSSKTVKVLDQEGEDGLDYKALYDNMYIHHLTESTEQCNLVYRSSPVTDERMLRKEIENKAASVIGAYVKGYLVRRLIKTVKVQTLIQTIQDALLCALELQGLETIEEADVELHRRLIQQVSAACYEFHDVFFVLTVPEQMDLIATDREKKQRILPVRTSRSSIDFRPKSRSSSNARLTKSLTKV